MPQRMETQAERTGASFSSRLEYEPADGELLWMGLPTAIVFAAWLLT
jgi:hypothetical protein